MATGHQNIYGRIDHSTIVIGDLMYLGGGGPINLPQVHNEKKRRLTSQVYIFDITSGNWDIKSTKGSPPLGVSGYFCATVKEKIFTLVDGVAMIIATITVLMSLILPSLPGQSNHQLMMK